MDISDDWPPSSPGTLPKLWGSGYDNGPDLSSCDADLDGKAHSNMQTPQAESESWEGQMTYAQRVSEAEYARQANEFTKSAVDQLVASDDYQRRTNRCQMCWCGWHEGQSSSNCEECGGHAMSRPCPVCDGRCGKIWSRDVDMTHAYHEAHWVGECSLPVEDQRAFLQAKIMEVPIDETDLVHDFEILQTHND